MKVLALGIGSHACQFENTGYHSKETLCQSIIVCLLQLQFLKDCKSSEAGQ